MNYVISQLPQHLFWDSDISKLDDIDDYEKIIVRAFERGDLEDMATVITFYGKGNCREVMTQAVYLQERAIIFASLFLSAPEKSFKALAAKQHHTI